jgi:hypothetical protein
VLELQVAHAVLFVHVAHEYWQAKQSWLVPSS